MNRSRSKPFTRNEVTDLFRLHEARIVATVERGFAPDEQELARWAAEIVGVRSNPLESLSDALELAAEFDVSVNVHLNRDGGILQVTAEDANRLTDELYEGPVSTDACVAIVAWLHNHDTHTKEAA